MKREWLTGTPRLWVRAPVPIAFCSGCQHASVLKILCELVDEMDIEGDTILMAGVGCSTMAAMLVDFDSGIMAHGRPCDAASAIKRILGKEKVVLTWQGDGDAFAIGTEPTLHAAARGEKITTIMVNNANYGTTGGQLGPTSVMGQITTTSPEGREELQGYPISVAELLANLKGVAYSARGALTTPANYQRVKRYMKTALQKQIDNIGYSFVEILAVCPPNWRLSPKESLQWIEERMIPQFPLGEFKNVDKIT